MGFDGPLKIYLLRRLVVMCILINHEFYGACDFKLRKQGLIEDVQN